MKITLTLDNVPTIQSAEAIRTALKRRRVKIMELCRRHHMTDVYNQFQSWLSGTPNSRQWRNFIRALKKEEIISEIERESP